MTSQHCFNKMLRNSNYYQNVGKNILPAVLVPIQQPKRLYLMILHVVSDGSTVGTNTSEVVTIFTTD